MEAALTPKEWDSGLVYCHSGYNRIRIHDDGDGIEFTRGIEKVKLDHWAAEDYYAAAAMLLKDQPFGFTWDDVDLLTRASNLAIDEFRDDLCDELRELRDRIAALLPPRPPIVIKNCVSRNNPSHGFVIDRWWPYTAGVTADG